MFSPALTESTSLPTTGYWDETTRNKVEACENLMEKLLAFLPKKEGTILDVACGKGATTRYLLRYFKSENVTGINISEKQLARCRENAPGCTFLLMSATELKFADESFDNIQLRRRRFILSRARNSSRRLSACSSRGDRLFSRRALCKTQRRTRHIAVRRMTSAGWENIASLPVCLAPVRVVDAICPCWLQFYRQAAIRIRRQFRRGILPLARYERRMQRLNRKLDFIRYYVLACAQKPQRAQQADT